MVASASKVCNQSNIIILRSNFDNGLPRSLATSFGDTFLAFESLLVGNVFVVVSDAAAAPPSPPPEEEGGGWGWIADEAGWMLLINLVFCLRSKASKSNPD